MKREIVSTNIKIFGGIFFIMLSSLELINLGFILFSNFKLNDSSTFLINLILNLEYGLLFSFITWFFLLALIIFFLIIGFYLMKFSQNQLSSIDYSRFIFLIGVIIIILTFSKMEMVYYIETGNLSCNGRMVNFEKALTDFHYMPIYSYYMWRFLTLSDCFRLTFGMVMGGFGLYWLLIQEKKENRSKT